MTKKQKVNISEWIEKLDRDVETLSDRMLIYINNIKDNIEIMKDELNAIEVTEED